MMYILLGVGVIIGAFLLAAVIGCWVDVRYWNQRILEAISVRHGEVVDEDGTKRSPRNRTEEYMERLKEAEVEMKELRDGS